MSPFKLSNCCGEFWIRYTGMCFTSLNISWIIKIIQKHVQDFPQPLGGDIDDGWLCYGWLRSGETAGATREVQCRRPHHPHMEWRTKSSIDGNGRKYHCRGILKHWLNRHYISIWKHAQNKNLLWSFHHAYGTRTQSSCHISIIFLAEGRIWASCISSL